jgi:methylated-DNA-[protein]-cysteine S-methyltransferase
MKWMDEIFFSHTGETPLGDIWVAASEEGLVAVEFPSSESEFTALLTDRYGGPVNLASARLTEALTQLREYAEGRRREFTLPVDLSRLTPFQRLALEATREIPYGETRTYKEIAVLLGNPRSARAVGRAEALNPLSLVIPCHRVIGSDHKLHGYGSGEGLKTKDWLLRMEGGLP